MMIIMLLLILYIMFMAVATVAGAILGFAILIIIQVSKNRRKDDE